MSDDVVYDCCTCGACCCEGFDVLLSPGEAGEFESRPGLRRLTVIHTLSNGWNLRFLDKQHPTGRCIALRGLLGDVYCGIYADRPFLCRDFAAGSAECIEIRRKYGFPVGPAPSD